MKKLCHYPTILTSLSVNNTYIITYIHVFDKASCSFFYVYMSTFFQFCWISQSHQQFSMSIKPWWFLWSFPLHHQGAVASTGGYLVSTEVDCWARRKWKDLSHCGKGDSVSRENSSPLFEWKSSCCMLQQTPVCDAEKILWRSTGADLLQGEELNSVVDVKTFDKLLSGSSFSLKDDEKNVTRALDSMQQCTSSERFLPSYEHIFVDEGQDLYSDKWPDMLKCFTDLPRTQLMKLTS